jgi:hypothetical protein
VDAERCFNIEYDGELSIEQTATLHWLLTDFSEDGER